MSNAIVKPILPSHIFELIYKGWDGEPHDPWLSGSSAMLEKHARWLDMKTDYRVELDQCCVTIETLLDESVHATGADRVSTQKNLLHRLFAGRLLQSLWHLRYNDAVNAQHALRKASILYLVNPGPFVRVEAIESLGLVAFLVAELEHKLAG